MKRRAAAQGALAVSEETEEGERFMIRGELTAASVEVLRLAG